MSNYSIEIIRISYGNTFEYYSSSMKWINKWFTPSWYFYNYFVLNFSMYFWCFDGNGYGFWNDFGANYETLPDFSHSNTSHSITCFVICHSWFIHIGNLFHCMLEPDSGRFISILSVFIFQTTSTFVVSLKWNQKS